MSTGLPPFGGNLDRLQAILDAYGGDPLRWPEAERGAALALVARSADARRLHEEALRLDAALDVLPAAEGSADLEDRIVAAALLEGVSPRRTAAVRPIADAHHAQRVPESAQRVTGGAQRVTGGAQRVTGGAQRVTGAQRVNGRRRAGLLTAALPIAVAAALALWISGRTVKTPAVAPANVASAEIKLADLGVFEVPGDELLQVSVLDDAYDAEPLNACADDDLACLQLETLPLDPLSRDEQAVQKARFLS